jgi:hypothetical protein
MWTPGHPTGHRATRRRRPLGPCGIGGRGRGGGLASELSGSGCDAGSVVYLERHGSAMATRLGTAADVESARDGRGVWLISRQNATRCTLGQVGLDGQPRRPTRKAPRDAVLIDEFPAGLLVYGTAPGDGGGPYSALVTVDGAVRQLPEVVDGVTAGNLVLSTVEPGRVIAPDRPVQRGQSPAPLAEQASRSAMLRHRGARRGGCRCTPPVWSTKARIDGLRLPRRRAISRSDSPCRHRAHTSSCSAADSPQTAPTTSTADLSVSAEVVQPSIETSFVSGQVVRAVLNRRFLLP